MDADKRKIIGATGAIPFIENMPDEAIERFQQQMEIVSMIDVEDAAAIQSQVNECIEKDPGAAESETMIIKLDEDHGEEVDEGINWLAKAKEVKIAVLESLRTRLLCFERNT